MPTTPKKPVPQEVKTSLIDICSYENKTLEGFLFNPYYGVEMHFSNLIEFVFLIENMLDDLTFPQKGMETRGFALMPEIKISSMGAKTAAEQASRLRPSDSPSFFARTPAGRELSLGWTGRCPHPSGACLSLFT